MYIEDKMTKCDFSENAESDLFWFFLMFSEKGMHSGVCYNELHLHFLKFLT